MANIAKLEIGGKEVQKCEIGGGVYYEKQNPASWHTIWTGQNMGTLLPQQWHSDLPSIDCIPNNAQKVRVTGGVAIMYAGSEIGTFDFNAVEIGTSDTILVEVPNQGIGYCNMYGYKSGRYVEAYLEGDIYDYNLLFVGVITKVEAYY